MFNEIILPHEKMHIQAKIGTDETTKEVIKSNQENEKNNELWQIEISCIDLIANIEEGTSKETLNRNVGHFDETEKEFGNVGLAAHNRGYDVNYFSRLKELIIDDEIIYTVNGHQRKYKVSLITIIDDTDWKYLEKTNDNRLTLITCVENVPEKRRCIQAIEKENL